MDTNITGRTRLYAVIGNPISHSISPAIQNSIFAAHKYDGKYISLKVSPDSLGAAVSVLRENFSGFNVTIPHKQAIMGYLDDVEDHALLCGAVNTVKNDKGRLIGFNTDGYGFIKAFDHFNIAVARKKVLLLGAGGAARAVLGELLARRCQVTIINRSLERARQLEQEFNRTYHGAVSACTANDATESYYCLINTTPVGMAPVTDALPVDTCLLKNIKVVYDIIYNPGETKLLAAAKEQGCTIINGFPMLFYQAVKANYIWTGMTLSAVDSRELFRQAAQYLENMTNE